MNAFEELAKQIVTQNAHLHPLTDTVARALEAVAEATRAHVRSCDHQLKFKPSCERDIAQRAQEILGKWTFDLRYLDVKSDD